MYFLQPGLQNLAIKKLCQVIFRFLQSSLLKAQETKEMLSDYDFFQGNQNFPAFSTFDGSRHSCSITVFALLYGSYVRMSDSFVTMFAKSAHVLVVTCGSLYVLASVIWQSLSKTGSCACGVYKQKQKLKSDWTEVTFAGNISCTNSPTALGCHSLLKAAIFHLLPIKSNCSHGRDSTCMNHTVIGELRLPFSCLLSHYFITPDVRISQMYK